MEKVKIVGMTGSLRRSSFNYALLETAGDFFPSHVEFEIVDLSVVPLYDQDLEQNVPAAIEQLAAKVKEAHGLLISTPEYNHSIPGVLKNALDWLSRPVVDTPITMKPVAIMGATPGMLGTVRAQKHLRDILFSLQGQTITRPEVLIGHAKDKFDQYGVLTDEVSRGKVRGLVDQLVSAVELSIGV